MKIMVITTESRYDGRKANCSADRFRFGGQFLDFVFDIIEEERGSLEEPYELVDASINGSHAFAVWKWRGTDRQRTVDIVAID